MHTRRSILATSVAAAAAVLFSAPTAGFAAPVAEELEAGAATPLSAAPWFRVFIGSKKWVDSRVSDMALAEASRGRSAVLDADGELSERVRRNAARFEDMADIPMPGHPEAARYPGDRRRSLIAEMRMDPFGVHIQNIDDMAVTGRRSKGDTGWPNLMFMCGYDTSLGVPMEDVDAAMARLMAGTKRYQWDGVRVFHEHDGEITARFLRFAEEYHEAAVPTEGRLA